MNNALYAEEKILRNGFIAKRIGYKWGLYNNEGDVLMRPLYDYISINQESRIWARFKGEKFYVDEEKLPFPFDFIHDSETDKDWYVIESNGYLGVADKHLEIVIPIEYKYIINYGGILWVTNNFRHGDIAKRITRSFIDCALFSYEGKLISNTKYNLVCNLSMLPVSPEFPILSNNDGFNILNNDNKEVLSYVEAFDQKVLAILKNENENDKEVLSIPASNIKRINDWFIIEYGKPKYKTQQFLYNIKKSCFIQRFRYSEIKQWKKDTNVFVCKCESGFNCDVFNGEKFIAQFDYLKYSLVDVVDEFVIVRKTCDFKYGFINKKGMFVPCIYDQVTCYRGAVNIIKAELYEETSKEYKEEAQCVHRSNGPDLYVLKGRYDVFGFDGYCISEGNDILSSILLWNKVCDSFFIEKKYIERINPLKIGTEGIFITQFNAIGERKFIYNIKETYWNNRNNNLEIKLENGSSISIGTSPSFQDTIKEVQNDPKPIMKTYSTSEKIIGELSYSDYKVFDIDLIPVIKDGKWGYKNERNETIIPFEYDEAEPFSDGLAAVRKGNLFGFIDSNNNVIIDFKFVKVEPFIMGLAKFDNNPEGIYNDHFHDYYITDEGYISKDGFYIDYVYKQRKYDYNYERTDYARDTWEAMTDGMYGDYPGSGVDYDTIGFGI